MRKILKVIVSLASVAFFFYTVYQIGNYIFSLAGDNLLGKIFITVIFIAVTWLGIYLAIKLFTDDAMREM